MVTAQRRSENLQNVPVSVAAFSGAALRKANIQGATDLPRIDPAVQVSNQGGILATFMRGVGNPVTTVGNEASVPVYIDDVYYSRLSPAFFDLANVDRIEALKGPQGTLFGRNASGGAISIYTVDPGATPKLEESIGYGNYDTFRGQFYASTPVTDTLAADLSISGLKQSGGWGRNTTTGQPTYRNQYISIRSKWIWRPTEDTTVRLIGYYVGERSEQGQIATWYEGTSGSTPNVAIDAPGNGLSPAETAALQATYGPVRPLQNGFYDIQNDYPTYTTSRGYGGSLNIQQRLGHFATLTSITAGRTSTELYRTDGDISPYNYSHYDLHVADKQFSQELRLNSLSSSKLIWVLGAYYLHSREGYDPTAIGGDLFTAVGAASGVGFDQLDLYGIQTVNSYAAFGQATYPILPKTNVTIGLRYTIDKLSAMGRTDLVFPDGSTFTGTPSFEHHEFKKLTYKFAIDHHFSDGVMAYASYSRGYKAGTYNTLPLSAEPLNPEVIDAYEVGLKAELFDRRLRLNGALFRNDISNPQVQTSVSGLAVNLNAGGARTQGVELSGEGALGGGLTVHVAVDYLDAKWTDFKNAPILYELPGGGLDNPLNCGTPAIAGNPCDITGRTMPRAPKWKIVGGFDKTFDIDNWGSFDLNANADYTSRYFWEADQQVSQKPQVLIGSSLSFTPASMDKLTFRIWVENLTDRHYYLVSYEKPGGAGHQAAPAAPRTFGGEIRFKF